MYNKVSKEVSYTYIWDAPRSSSCTPVLSIKAIIYILVTELIFNIFTFLSLLQSHNLHNIRYLELFSCFTFDNSRFLIKRCCQETDYQWGVTISHNKCFYSHFMIYYMFVCSSFVLMRNSVYAHLYRLRLVMVHYKMFIFLVLHVLLSI